MMFKFIANLFRKSENVKIESSDSGKGSPIEVKFNEIGVSLYINGEQKEDVKWCDINLIAISIEDEFLPSPFWYVGNKENLIRIPNDAIGGNELFFDGFSNFINGYASDKTYETIIDASSALEGSFVVWKHDSVKIPNK